MDGLAVAKQARVDLAELVLDPAHPFRVQAAPRVPDKRRATIRAAMMGAGWGDLDDAGRVPLARALLGRMDEKAWRSFFDVSVDGRMTAEPDPLKRWADPPWIWWRLVLDDEWDRRVAAERARVAAIPPVQASRGGAGGCVEQRLGGERSGAALLKQSSRTEAGGTCD
jgi:hypothetical protein